MRVLPTAFTATMAAAVLAIGPAQSLPTGGEVAASDAAIVKVQQKEGGARSRERGDRGGAEFGDRDRRDRGDRDRRRDGGGFYFGFGPGGPSVGYGRRGDGGGCGWLRQRALETGSSYWWGRYRQCAR